MAKYRKKPVVVEAIQWNGDNKEEIRQFISGREFFFDDNGNLFIRTLEGDMKANKGDYVIRGIKGEFYPCKPDVFEQTYEPVED